jgi:predicted MFS family arabinose efflux permease
LLSILTLWINRVLELGPRDIGLIFLYSGFIGAVCQLVLIGPITKRIGENAVVMWSIAGMGLGLAVLAMTASVTMTLLAMTLVSAAHSFFSPVSTAMVSHFAEPAERGMVLGVFQGIGSLGRVAGPAFAGVAFAQISYSSPYWISALLTLPALVLAVGIMRRAQPG